MRVKTILRGVIGLACMGLLSCGGDGRRPMDATSTSIMLGQLKTQLAAIPQSNTTPTFVTMSGVNASSLSTKSLGCYTVNPDPAVDADGDGIALEKTYTINCTKFADGTSSLTQKGTIVFKDLDDTVDGVFGGMRAEYNVPVMSIETDGLKYNYSHVGFWEYVNKNGSLISTSQYTGSNAYEVHGFKNNYSYTQDWNYTMTPDDVTPANAFTKGTITMSGSFKMTGDFVIEVDSKHQQYNGTWVISYSSKDLTYDNSCATYYKSGSIVISDSSNKMEIKYDCTSSKLYVNGKESDWWRP